MQGHEQAWVVLATRGLDLLDPSRRALELAAAILGGQGGRLFIELREKLGLAYSVWADSLSGLDTGRFQCGLATDPKRASEATRHLHDAVRALAATPPSQEELDRCRRMLIGHAAMALQRASGRAATAAIGERLGIPWGMAAYQEAFEQRDRRRGLPGTEPHLARRHCPGNGTPSSNLNTAGPVLLVLLVLNPSLADERGFSEARDRPEQVPETVDFTVEEWDQLRGQEVVWRYERLKGHDLGVAARLTQASAHEVWSQIIGFDDWVAFLPYVTHSSVKKVHSQMGHPVVDARFALTVKGITTWHEIRHHAFPHDGYLAFHLLETTRSALKGTMGYWTVDEQAEGTLVTFRVDMSPAWYVPGGIRKKAARVGLPRLLRLMVERAEGGEAVAELERALGHLRHVPWCRVRCPYCSFYVEREDQVDWASFVDAVLRERDRRQPLFAGEGPPTTLALGGGTPSRMPPMPLDVS